MLLRECGIDTVEQALSLLRRLYPRREPPLKTRLFLEELLEGGQRSP